MTSDGGDLENRALDDLAFRDVPEAVIVDVQEPGVLGGVDLVVVVARPGFQRRRDRPRGRSRSARSLRRDALDRTGSVLVFYVRHALRVLLCRSIAGLMSASMAGDCRRVWWRVGEPVTSSPAAPRQRSLNSDKQQRVRHLSPNCQGSERTRSWPNGRPETRGRTSRRGPQNGRQQRARVNARPRRTAARPRKPRLERPQPSAANGRRSAGQAASRRRRPRRRQRTTSADRRQSARASTAPGGRSTKRPDAAVVAGHGPPRLGRAHRPRRDGRDSLREHTRHDARHHRRRRRRRRRGRVLQRRRSARRRQPDARIRTSSTTSARRWASNTRTTRS